MRVDDIFDAAKASVRRLFQDAFMDFDLCQIAVPFRMQPGLRRMGIGERHLTPLDPGGSLYREKLRVLDAGQCFHVQPGFDCAKAHDAIADRAALEGHAWSANAPQALPLAFEEDFALLDGDTGRLVWLCVCTPSHWAPEDKLGLDFAAVHAPVADSAALQSAGSHLVQLAAGGGRWERFVWTISPSPLHDQHPRRQARTPWPRDEDASRFAAQCFLRAERQTFFPAAQNMRLAVFTIRVTLLPLAQAVRNREVARRLHDSLASMSEAVLAYKNLTTARAPVLQWLNQHYP